MTESLLIRPATPQDADALWRMLEPTIRAGETFALPRDMSANAALAYWLSPGHAAFVAEADGAIVGSYYLKANQQGGGGHVANAGYTTNPAVRGRGIARRMCEHSLGVARTQGFRAMQFNFVISSNAPAVALWTSLGFSIVGRLPDAFAHPTLGDVDALVMFQTL